MSTIIDPKADEDVTVADEALKRIFSGKDYKVPLDIDEQHELRGELLSCLLELRSAEDSIELFKQSLEELTKLNQELIKEIELKNMEISRLNGWWQYIRQRRPLGANR